MSYSILLSILFVYVLLIVRIKSDDDYGLYHYSFDDDPLIAACTKPKPLIFELMYDFLTMIKGESNKPMQQCVVRGEGPGFTSPPSVARTIFAVTTIAYNTYARYSQNAEPVTKYVGWTRMSQTQQKVPDCIYIYAFYHIAHFLMPERSTNYTFKEKYEGKYNCSLTQVVADANSEFGLVQRDVDQLKSQLRIDGFNQEGCFADTSNFR